MLDAGLHEPASADTGSGPDGSVLECLEVGSGLPSAASISAPPLLHCPVSPAPGLFPRGAGSLLITAHPDIGSFVATRRAAPPRLCLRGAPLACGAVRRVVRGGRAARARTRGCGAGRLASDVSGHPRGEAHRGGGRTEWRRVSRAAGTVVSACAWPDPFTGRPVGRQGRLREPRNLPPPSPARQCNAAVPFGPLRAADIKLCDP